MADQGNVTTQAIDEAGLAAMAAKSGDTPEHLAAMAAKADGKGPAQGTENLLAGKYKDEAALKTGFDSLVEKYGTEKAYKILETEMGKTAQSQDPLNPTDPIVPKTGDALNPEGGDPVKPAADALTDPNKAADAAKVVADAKLDFAKLNDEFAQNGELSKDSYEKLSNAGLSTEMVDQYIAGIAASTELLTTKVYGLAGGEENFNTLIEWAGDNLNAAETQNFNNAVTAGDMDKLPMMVEALKTRYEADQGSMGDRKRVEGEGVKPAVGGYGSKAEMTADMRDPRYKLDASYRKSVMDKLAKTTAF
jgi:hypothetical protein